MIISFVMIEKPFPNNRLMATKSSAQKMILWHSFFFYGDEAYIWSSE